MGGLLLFIGLDIMYLDKEHARQNPVDTFHVFLCKFAALLKVFASACSIKYGLSSEGSG